MTGAVAGVLAPVRGAWVAGLESGCGDGARGRRFRRSGECAANDRTGYVPRIRTKNGSFSAARVQSPGDGTRIRAHSAIKVGFNVRATLTWLRARTVGPDSRDITPGTFLDDIR